MSTAEPGVALTDPRVAERRRNARLEVIDALVEDPDLAAAGSRILRALGDAFDGAAAILWMVDPAAAVLRFSDAWTAEPTAVAAYLAASRVTVFASGVGLPGIAWAERTGLLVPDFATDPRSIRTDGATRDAIHTAYLHPIRAAGDVLGVIELVSTERREIDAELLEVIATAAGSIGQLSERGRILAAVRRHNEELVIADQRKNEFIAVLAHELRNPLAPIASGLKILAAPATTAEEAEKARAAIERQFETLTRLVEDLVDVTRISTGRVQLRTEPVELAPVIARVVAELRPGIDRHGLALTVAIPSEPLWLDADPVRIEQVLTNLLVNAARYTDRGGRIWLTAAPVGQPTGQRRVVIAVRDTGIGITDEIREHVFDMFAATPALRGERSGLGVGLTLVKRLVEMHGGEVAVASPGAYKGSEFSVRLPLLPVSFTEELRAAAAAAAETQPMAPVPPVTAPAPRALRILIVDDDADTADTMQIILRGDGHEVHTSYDGPTALVAAAALAPDVVLLDIGLPGMNGWEVAARLRSEHGARPLLVAITGWGQPADRAQSQAIGFDHHLVKPARLDEIRAILAAAATRDAATPRADG